MWGAGANIYYNTGLEPFILFRERPGGRHEPWVCFVKDLEVVTSVPCILFRERPGGRHERSAPAVRYELQLVTLPSRRAPALNDRRSSRALYSQFVFDCRWKTVN